MKTNNIEEIRKTIKFILESDKSAGGVITLIINKDVLQDIYNTIEKETSKNKFEENSRYGSFVTNELIKNENSKLKIENKFLQNKLNAYMKILNDIKEAIKSGGDMYV